MLWWVFVVAVIAFAVVGAIGEASDRRAILRRLDALEAKAAPIDTAAAACARWDDSVRVLPEGGPTCGR